MALKQIMLNKRMQEKKNELAEVERKLQEFTIRESEIEKAIEEAGTEEEAKAVEEEIETYEKEKKAAEEEKETLENTISELEKELDDVREKPVNSKKREASREIGGEKSMDVIKRGAFSGKTVEYRERFLKNEEVKGFFERVKELAGEKRAVKGAELTIPDIALELLKDNLNRYSKLIAKVKLKSVAGKARQNIAGNIPEGIWTEAVGKLNELELTFHQIEVDGYKVGGYIPMHNSTLEDSEISMAEEILDALGQAIGFAVDKAILYGTGKKMPLGIVTRLAQIVKPENWGVDAPEWKDLHESNIKSLGIDTKKGPEFFAALMEALGIAEEDYSNGEKFWCMNSKTKSSIITKAVTFDAAGAIVASMKNEMPVIGGEIITLPFLKDKEIVGGYGSLYLLAERKGGTLAQSEHAKFIEDMTVFRGTARYDGMPIIGNGFVSVSIGTEAVTTSVTFAPDKANEESTAETA